MSHCLWQTHGMSVLALNAGSSSIRFALFEAGSPPLRARGGKIERIGHGDAQLSVIDAGAIEAQAPVAVGWDEFRFRRRGLAEMARIPALVRRGPGRRTSRGPRDEPHRAATGDPRAAQRPQTDRCARSRTPAAGNPAGRGHRREAPRPCLRCCVSTPRFTAGCRGARRSCRFRGGMNLWASGDTGSMACRTRTSCRSLRDCAILMPRTAGWSSRISGAVQASPPCVTGAASTPPWASPPPAG